MHIVVYDLETAKEVSDLPGGWDDAKKGHAGISALVIWDTATQRFHLYDTYTVSDGLAHINAADLAVGFNTLGFDGPCLQRYVQRKIISPQFDINAAIRRSAGLYARGYKLKQVAARTLGVEPWGEGTLAPLLFKQGRMAELLDYCLQDVHYTRLLYNYVVEHGHVIAPNGEPLMLSDLPTEKA